MLLILKNFVQEGVKFTAAIRNPDQIKQKFGFEKEIVYLVFKDPYGFPKALEGVKPLFLCGPSANPEADQLLLKLC